MGSQARARRAITDLAITKIDWKSLEDSMVIKMGVGRGVAGEDDSRFGGHDATYL